MKKQNKYAGRIELPAPPAYRLANLFSQYRSLSIVVVICACIAGLSAYAGNLLAQSSEMTLAGGDVLVANCDGRGFTVVRLSRTRLSLECLANAGSPQPTATATTVPPQPTNPPPTAPPPTAVPPTATPASTTVPSPTPQPEPTTPPTGGSAFLATFDGAPAAPLAWTQVSGFGNWDVTVHRRSTDLTMQSISAHHGPGCEHPPENTHANDSYEGAVFQCNNHIMTAVNDDGYGVIYLTPNQILDFANGKEAVVRFDMSTLKTSSRDWVSLWISPYAEHLQLPLDINVDLQGVPHNGILIDLTPELAFVPSITRNGTTVKYQFDAPGVNWWVGYDDFFVPSAMQRQTFELRLSQTHLKFCMPAYNFCWIDMPIQAPLTWNQGIIQFAHHSYNPTKDNSGTPDTWHWDNFEIENGIPFTIIKSDRRYVDSQTSVIQLGQPAPANAHLRFAGIGRNLEVSFDGGATWQMAQKNLQGNDEYHFASYWTPIPVGTTTVMFRGSSWGSGEAWQARDMTVWARP